MTDFLQVDTQQQTPASGPGAPPAGVRPGTRGSTSNIHWLSCNRHVTEKQLFAHVTSEMQSHLAAAARGRAPAWPDGHNDGLRHHGRKPAVSTDYGYVEVRFLYPSSSPKTQH